MHVFLATEFALPEAASEPEPIAARLPGSSLPPALEQMGALA